MKQKNAISKFAVQGASAKSGNVAFLVLAVIALVLFIAVVVMQYQEMSYFKDWTL
jgi:hypothetical protein